MEYHQFFTQIDWLVVAGYLALTTWVGHALKGKQSTIKDFFLGGRTLPWPAVSGSIIATEISGVTFIGVPGMVYAATGDFTYLQWGLGSILRDHETKQLKTQALYIIPRSRDQIIAQLV